MKNKPILLIAVVFAVALLVYAVSHNLYAPGELHAKHQQIKECDSCHQPFTKPTGQTCVAVGCHDAAYWDKRKGISTAHLRPDGCLKCHTEHVGSNGNITPYPHHEGVAETDNCLECHRIGAPHVPVKVKECRNCHIMKAWRPATFDHAALKGETCATCHTLPQKHVQSPRDCAECHDTAKWKPAKKFDHALLTPTDRCLPCHALPEKHAATTADCRPCHTADKWKPAKKFDHALLMPGESCIVCHALPQKHVATSMDCGPCHETAKWKPAKKFDHTLLRRGDSCIACHRLPQKHVATNAECDRCHLIDKWKPATFDHALLKRGDTCTSCHALPQKHMKSGSDCGTCHATTKWKPASIKHTFPMNHEQRRGAQIKCEVCHPQSYDTYTCYGCHEHSERKVASEHREEGIRDYANCMKCHPTGREHEMRGGESGYEGESEHEDEHEHEGGLFRRLKRKVFDDD